MSLLAFDRCRLEWLRIGIGAAIDDLHAIRNDDEAAADVMRGIRKSCGTLGDSCLPRVHDILGSEAMTSFRPAELGDDIHRAAMYRTAHDRGWEVTTDLLQVYGPAVPGVRTFDQVLADIRSGELVPMVAPIDANGRSGAQYTSLTFAPGHQRQIGQQDLTSNVLKVIDFFSDGLPIGWREHRTLTITYLPNVRVTNSVHVLTAYDRDEGPETLVDQTTEAVVSGYMVVADDSSTAEVSVGIGPGTQDPTQSFVVASEAGSSYSGMFYPDHPPDFRPITHEARFVDQDRWTFTTSSAPMMEGWGTWKA
jgi:hypothetical protein